MSESTDQPVRPTKRGMDDLGIEVPEIDAPLHAIDQADIRGVQAIPKQLEAGGAKRLVGLKDRVWFKYKFDATRGAVTRLGEAEVAPEVAGDSAVGRWWAGAFGPRNADSPQRDFYSQLVSECERHGKALGTGRGSSEHLLPQDWDIRRLSAELSIQWVDAINDLVIGMIAESLGTGKQVIAEAEDQLITAAVRATSKDEAYLIISAVGVPDARVQAAVLSSVPGIDANEWMPDQVVQREGLDLKPESGEVVWSTLLSPKIQALILELAGDNPLGRKGS